MEEYRVSLLHDKVNPGTRLSLIKQPMEKFVGFTLEKKGRVEIIWLKLEEVPILSARDSRDRY